MSSNKAEKCNPSVTNFSSQGCTVRLLAAAAERGIPSVERAPHPEGGCVWQQGWQRAGWDRESHSSPSTSTGTVCSTTCSRAKQASAAPTCETSLWSGTRGSEAAGSPAQPANAALGCHLGRGTPDHRKALVITSYFMCPQAGAWGGGKARAPR